MRNLTQKEREANPHPVDSIDDQLLQAKVVQHHVKYDPHDKSEEAKARAIHLSKLRKIMRIEHEICGVPDW